MTPPRVSDHRLIRSGLNRTTTVRAFPINVANRCMPLAAGLVIPGWTSSSSGDDFDLYLTRPDGRQVDASTTTQRQESVSVVSAQTGRYTLRVRAYAGEGPFFVDVSAGLAPPPPSARLPVADPRPRSGRSALPPKALLGSAGR